MKFDNPILMNAVANTGTKHSQVLDTRWVITGSIQATFTDGAAAGTLILEGSNDPIELLPAGIAPITWNTVANTSTAVVSGASKLVTVQTLNYRWLRVTWTQSGGAGTLTVTGFFQGF